MRKYLPLVILFVIVAVVAVILAALWWNDPSNAGLRATLGNGSVSNESSNCFQIQTLKVQGTDEQHLICTTAFGRTKLVKVPMDNLGKWKVINDQKATCFDVDTNNVDGDPVTTESTDCQTNSMVDPGEVFSISCQADAQNCRFEMIRTPSTEQPAPTDQPVQ